MKKILVSMLAGTLIIGGAVLSVSAATGQGTTNVGYTSGAITDPDNPSNPTWSVSIPKDFVFTDGNLTKNVDVILNEIGSVAFPDDKQVQVDVESKNGYTLNNANATVKNLDYELKYEDALKNTDGKIGDLTAGDKTLEGTATLEGTQLTNIGVDGTYKDVLTYTVYSATAITP